jgi:hypothetical protein
MIFIPTEAMLIAAHNWSLKKYGRPFSNEAVIGCWQKMIEAMPKNTFSKDLELLINRHSQENGSNTPDHILADFLTNCLLIFDHNVNERAKWYGETPGWRLPGGPVDWPEPPTDPKPRLAEDNPSAPPASPLDTNVESTSPTEYSAAPAEDRPRSSPLHLFDF